jgi:hypothetical protein
MCALLYYCYVYTRLILCYDTPVSFLLSPAKRSHAVVFSEQSSFVIHSTWQTIKAAGGEEMSFGVNGPVGHTKNAPKAQ